MAKRPSGFRIDDPAWALLQAFISYWGITDADGGAGGADLQCADLANQPDFDGNHVVIISGPYGGQARDINGVTTGGTVTPNLSFGGQIVTGTIFAILPIRTTPAEVAAIAALIGTATDDGDAATLFAKLKQQYLGAHISVLLLVNDASALNLDLDTALKDELEDRGYVVVVGDPADVAGNLELSFDFIVVSGSITADTNLTRLREADCPVITHSAEVAVSTNIFSLGVTAGVQAAQTIINIIDNTLEWLIDTDTGDLAVTASVEIETMASVSGSTINVAEEAIATGTDITIARLKQGEADGSGVIHSFDRYFIGIKDFTNANAVFKAIMADLWEHVVHEVRFGEVTVTPKRVYQEQIPDTGFSISPDVTLGANPPSADSDNSIVDLDKKQNRTFCLRSLWVNVTDLGTGTNTMTFKLWIDIGGTATEVKSKDVTVIGYYDLMDLFGVPEAHGDSIHITAQVNATTGACAGIYRYAEARK